MIWNHFFRVLKNLLVTQKFLDTQACFAWTNIIISTVINKNEAGEGKYFHAIHARVLRCTTVRVNADEKGREGHTNSFIFTLFSSSIDLTISMFSCRRSLWKSYSQWRRETPIKVLNESPDSSTWATNANAFSKTRKKSTTMEVKIQNTISSFRK